MLEYIKDKVLMPEMAEAMSDKQLLEVLPTRIHLVDRRRRYNAVATKRWFYRKVKAQPEITYEQIVQQIYAN